MAAGGTVVAGRTVEGMVAAGAMEDMVVAGAMDGTVEAGVTVEDPTLALVGRIIMEEVTTPIMMATPPVITMITIIAHASAGPIVAAGPAAVRTAPASVIGVMAAPTTQVA